MVVDRNAGVIDEFSALFVNIGNHHPTARNKFLGRVKRNFKIKA
jgi:hypothetical protein